MASGCPIPTTPSIFGPWYESGFRYLWAAALETGLYLLLPLTWVAAASAGATYALVLLCITAHLYYHCGLVATFSSIAGLHWRSRVLGARLATGLPANVREWVIDYPRAWASLILVPVLFYASAKVSFCFILEIHSELDQGEHRAGYWWRRGLSRLPRQPIQQSVGMRPRHANSPTRTGSPRGVIPNDATIGALLRPHPLADRCHGRNPVTSPNYARLAHDHPATWYASPRRWTVRWWLWMLVQWANERFAGRDRARNDRPRVIASVTATTLGDSSWRFESGLEGSFTNRRDHAFYGAKTRFSGTSGPGF